MRQLRAKFVSLINFKERRKMVAASNVSKLCKGKGKTLKGYHLRYYNDTINA